MAGVTWSEYHVADRTQFAYVFCWRTPEAPRHAATLHCEAATPASIVLQTLGAAGMSLNAAQTDNTPSDTQVLIIGAGPAGLFAASELLRHGVRPRIVEQRRAPHRETRGTALQPAVLETLDRGGVVEPFLADSVRIKEIELLGPEHATHCARRTGRPRMQIRVPMQPAAMAHGDGVARPSGEAGPSSRIRHGGDVDRAGTAAASP